MSRPKIQSAVMFLFDEEARKEALIELAHEMGLEVTIAPSVNRWFEPQWQVTAFVNTNVELTTLRQATRRSEWL